MRNTKMLLIFLILFAAQSAWPLLAYAGWFSPAWSYRKKVTLAAGAGSGTSYQVRLAVGESAGSAGASFNLGGKCLSSLNDIRFTASDGNTPLSFWMQEVTGATPNQTAIYWVKVLDDLSTANKDIYVYYGNASAASASSGIGTFVFFDDFNDNSIDATKWLAFNGTWSEAGGIMSQTSAAALDPKKEMAIGGPTDNNFVMGAKVRVNTGTDADGRIGIGVKTQTTDGRGFNYAFHNMTTKTTEQFLNDQVAWGTSYVRAAWVLGTWYWFEVAYDGTNVLGRVWSLGTAPGALNSWAQGGRAGYMSLNGGSMANDTGSYDDVYIRKYTATPAAYSSVGAEENKTIWATAIKGTKINNARIK